MFEMIIDLSEDIRDIQTELAMAQLDNFSFIDFVELALELKYQTEVLGLQEWFVKKKLLQDRIYSENSFHFPIETCGSRRLREMTIIEKNISFFRDRINCYLSGLTVPIINKIYIMSVVGKILYLVIPTISANEYIANKMLMESSI